MLRSRPLILSASAAALIGLAVLPGVSCQIHTNPSPWSRVDVTDVSTNPDGYLGRMVDARGMVRQVYSPSAFAIAQDGSPDRQVLVLSSDPFPTTFPVKEGQMVAVLGTVRVYKPEEFKEPYGFESRPRDSVDPDQNLSPFLAWKDKPVIDAESIMKDSGGHNTPPPKEP